MSTKVSIQRVTSAALLFGLAMVIAAPSALAADAGTSAAAQASDKDKPKITEETPYVTSPKNVVDTMLRMAGVRSNDFVIDLGSGDGRIVITAALEYKARGIGIEYDRTLVKLANKNASIAGVSDRATFLEQDIFKSDFSQASVVTMYLLPQYNAVLQPALLALKPGTRIVSHDYGIGDWEPEAKEVIPAPEKTVGLKKESVILFWVVPARLQGRWTSTVQTRQGATTVEFDIKQKNQRIEGTAKLRGKEWPIERAYINGTYVSFRVGEGDDTLLFSGHAASSRINGQVVLSNNRNLRWRALKTATTK